MSRLPKTEAPTKWVLFFEIDVSPNIQIQYVNSSCLHRIVDAAFNEAIRGMMRAIIPGSSLIESYYLAVKPFEKQSFYFIVILFNAFLKDDPSEIIPSLYEYLHRPLEERLKIIHRFATKIFIPNVFWHEYTDDNVQYPFMINISVDKNSNWKTELELCEDFVQFVTTSSVYGDLFRDKPPETVGRDNFLHFVFAGVAELGDAVQLKEIITNHLKTEISAHYSSFNYVIGNFSRYLSSLQERVKFAEQKFLIELERYIIELKGSLYEKHHLFIYDVDNNYIKNALFNEVNYEVTFNQQNLIDFNFPCNFREIMVDVLKWYYKLKIQIDGMLRSISGRLGSTIALVSSPGFFNTPK